MNVILLLLGLFFFYIWIYGHPLGAVMAFLAATFSGLPAMLGASTPIFYLACGVALALTPMVIRWVYRDIRKGRGGHLAHFGNWYLTELRTPKPLKASKASKPPEGTEAPEPEVVWTRADLEAWARRESMKELHVYEMATGRLFERPLSSPSSTHCLPPAD